VQIEGKNSAHGTASAVCGGYLLILRSRGLPFSSVLNILLRKVTLAAKVCADRFGKQLQLLKFGRLARRYSRSNAAANLYPANFAERLSFHWGVPKNKGVTLRLTANGTSWGVWGWKFSRLYLRQLNGNREK
jgi:hypothetical protein